MSTEIILNRESQIILAEGRRPAFFGSWLMWSLLALILTGTLAFLLWLALSRPLPLPRGTFFLGVISSEAAQQIFPPNVLNALPDTWKRTLSIKSTWPLVYGLANEDGQMRAFIIGPRWLVPDGETRQTAGLSAYLGETGLVFEEEKLTYSEALSWRGLERAPAMRWSNGEKIHLRWNGKQLVSDMAWNMPGTSRASSADLSTGFSADSRKAATQPEIALASSLGDLPKLRNLPDISRYEVWLNGKGFARRRFEFSHPLSENQAAAVLGIFSVTERKAFTLPDGTISIERFTPSASTSTSLFGERKNDRNESLRLSANELQISSTTGTWDIQPAENCGVQGPWIRLSSRALSTTLTDIGWKVSAEQLRALQIGTINNKIAVCFE
ncbi:hypothetical protein IT407_04315 [Candidatus Uhrbacteria bacterium]|nr:hypothetical protein [Candidatus Uhrbacteria bacterium]